MKGGSWQYSGFGVQRMAENQEEREEGRENKVESPADL